MPKWLKTYLGIWIAVLPPVILAFASGYLVMEVWRPAWWVSLIIFLVVLHLMVGWVVGITKILQDRGW